MTGKYPSGSILRGDSYGLTLYPRATMFNHSCLPNVIHKPDARGRMVFTAIRDLSKGDECVITYFDLATYVDFEARRDLLHDAFHICCICPRCANN